MTHRPYRNRKGAKFVNFRSNKERRPSAREVALDVLCRVEQDRSYSNLLLNQTLQKYSLERADAALATEIVYGTIQRLNTIDFLLGRFVEKGMNKLQPWVRSLLRLSFYQLHYLDRIPAHAAVSEAVNIAKRKGHARLAGMVNAVLRNALRHKERLVIPGDLPPVKRIALTHSHPEWLVARWFEQYGLAVTEQICAANNTVPQTSVRANTLRHSRDELVELMRQDGLETAASPLAPAGIIVRGAGNMAHTRWYRDGELTIQDESSMLVAEIAAPRPGMRVLDCCAAPGGKTTHLAEKMGDRGEIWAADLHEHKVRLIEEQARRLGLGSIRTLVSDARRLPERLKAESFDCILLDAPCSGFGVIRRKPELKWSKEERDIAEIGALQRDILSSVHTLLKPGGTLVYSTCTIEREENEAVVESFLRKHPEFEPDRAAWPQLPSAIGEALRERGMVQILPHQYASDGFFIAKLRKRPKIC